MNKKLNPINQLIQQDQLESAKLAFIYTKFTKLIQDYILQNETLTQKKFDFQNKSKQSVQQIKKQEQEIKLLSETLKKCCLLYTSDAADEEDSVDLGGRRIIKKKKHKKKKSNNRDQYIKRKYK
eukprot:TRINITY_DN10027_c0_g1_i2.p2 TRINITY_DN10027_c0_g1~~TRINITY_DN10027_c0_g1_i2.p2  ORF type:complete len:124 (+),score=28.06 TRINITY_DN10027_c0_g1_i2:405-776(+)